MKLCLFLGDHIWVMDNGLLKNKQFICSTNNFNSVYSICLCRLKLWQFYCFFWGVIVTYFFVGLDRPGAHHPEHPTPTCLCNSVFTSWVIFRSKSFLRKLVFLMMLMMSTGNHTKFECRPSSVWPEWILVPLFLSYPFIFHHSNPLVTQNQFSHHTMHFMYI